ncbi:MAG: histidine kinase dimerization/phosphoacceptor domain-containing protein, partial [Pseudonocardia sp.]|nr:histidine kinase dimerization/phosphoacceptor domain-containing protein [Pseudonocardia sp.]
MTAAGSITAALGSGSARVVRRFAAPKRHLVFWVVGWLALAAAVIGVLVPLLAQGPAVTFQAVTVVFRIVGGSFAACGLVAWRRRPDNHIGRLMTATGFAFLASPLLAQLDAPLARTTGLLLRNVWLVLLVAILLTFLSGGRLRTRTDRVVVGAVAVSLLVISPLWLLFLDVAGNFLFVAADARTAAAVDAVQQWLYLPIALTVTAVVGARWWAASRPGRRALLPSVAGSVYLLFFTVVLTAGLVGLPVPYAVFWVLAFSVAMVPVAFLTGLLRSRLARGGLVELFRGMKAMHPADLRAALARALGDPGLVIAYPAGRGTFVDSADRPVTLPGADGDRSAAMVERDGQVIAALIYDRSLDDDPELVEAVGGAAAIALENQQLHVEAENRLAEVRASRERIIAAGDAERRRIERNLHDGAQQRLATLALQLSLIGRRIRGDPAAEQLVTSASGELARSLEELRELARGIHPAALDQGLDIALDALALRSAVPTTVCCDPGPRLPA